MNVSEILAAVRATSKGDRYSENLYKWLRKHRDFDVFVAFSAWSFIDGSTLTYNPAETQVANILLGTGGMSDGFCGASRLSNILANGVKAERWAFHTKQHQITLLPNWLEEYVKGGKCFIDPEHRLYSDRERWQVSENGQRRSCAWCGEHKQYLRTEVVLRKGWRNF